MSSGLSSGLSRGLSSGFTDSGAQLSFAFAAHNVRLTKLLMSSARSVSGTGFLLLITDTLASRRDDAHDVASVADETSVVLRFLLINFLCHYLDPASCVRK